MKTECKNCGRELPVGTEAVELGTYAEGVYCSQRCAEEALADAIDEIYDDIAVDVTIESDDPYDRYGVSEGDFH